MVSHRIQKSFAIYEQKRGNSALFADNSLRVEPGKRWGETRSEKMQMGVRVV